VTCSRYLKNMVYPTRVSLLWLTLAGLSLIRTTSVAASDVLKEGLALYDQVGLRIHLCLPICLLAEAYLKSEQYQKGMEQANLAMAISSEIGDRWCLPRLHTIRGRLFQTLGQGDAAETSLKMAVDVAAMQAAKGVQLHTANSLARLWRSQGKVQQARELLAPVYGWFTEGFDTRDLKEAKALLEELA
jgi:predicted ATPase